MSTATSNFLATYYFFKFFLKVVDISSYRRNIFVAVQQIVSKAVLEGDKAELLTNFEKYGQA